MKDEKDEEANDLSFTPRTITTAYIPMLINRPS